MADQNEPEKISTPDSVLIDVIPKSATIKKAIAFHPEIPDHVRFQQRPTSALTRIMQTSPLKDKTYSSISVASVAKDNAFFTLLDLQSPRMGGNPSDLEKYFGRRAFELAVVNPYLDNAKEKILDFKNLPMTQFNNKMKYLCPNVKFLSPFFFLFDNHFELGKSVLFQQPRWSFLRQNGHPQLKFYKRFLLYRSTFRVVIFIAIFVMSIVYLAVYYSNYNISKGGVPYPDHCSISILQVSGTGASTVFTFQFYYQGQLMTSTDYQSAKSMTQSELGCTSYRQLDPPAFIWTLVSLFGIGCLSIYTSYYRLAKRGVLRYLRQLGTPIVEEVMISYSWQNGLSQDVRCIAKSLLVNGIGVWIDVLKLTSGDKTSRTTRTVAAHARFVLIVLTTRYINSPACFVEMYEALRTPGAADRVVIFAPDETMYTAKDKLAVEDILKVGHLAAQLEAKGLRVLRRYSDLVYFLNCNVIYCVDRSHFVWWRKYVGPTSGIPDDAVPPDPKANRALSKCNLKLFMLPSFTSQGNRNCWRNEVPFRFRKNGLVMINRIRITNVWISGDLRETGQNASAFPWPLFVLVCLLCLPFYDLSLLVSNPTANAVPVSFIFLALFLGLFASSLDAGVLVDRRIYMNPCLKPIIATNNFSLSKKAPCRWVGQRSPRWCRPQSSPIAESMSSLNITTKFSKKQIYPDGSSHDAENGKLYVAVHDFETNHICAINLRQFLQKIGCKQPKSEEENFNPSAIVVHVFIFGGGLSSNQTSAEQEEIIKRQVRQFNDYLLKNQLQVEETVLVGVSSERANMEIPGLFGATVRLPWQEDASMGSYLILLGTALGQKLGEEVLIQTGLRVKNALKRYDTE